MKKQVKPVVAEKKKTPWDGIKIKPPTKAQLAKIVKEIEENNRRRREGPPPPGDREVAWGLRAEILKDEKCVVCKSPLEQLWALKFPNNDIIGPGGRGHWAPDGRRCTNCKLAYDTR